MIETPVGTFQSKTGEEPGYMNGSGVRWAGGRVLHDRGTPGMRWDKAEARGERQSRGNTQGTAI